MTSRGLEIRVGAVVLLAAILLVVGTMWFQRFQVAGPDPRRAGDPVDGQTLRLPRVPEEAAERDAVAHRVS